MRALPDPVWPLLVLAAIQLVDSLLCLKPVPFIARCFDAVGWPRTLWWVMTPLKLAAATGLVLGIWVPYLAVLTCTALVTYFLVAVGMHLRARDLGRNLFVNATGMLLICLLATVFCFLV